MVRRLLVVFGLLLTILAIPGSSSAALNLCAERIAPTPERINASFLGGDTDEWTPAPPMGAAEVPEVRPEMDPRGVYGSIGMAGQFWNKITSSDCFDDTRWQINHDLAGLTWGAVRSVNTWTLRVFGWAASDDINDLFAPLVVDVMAALRDSFWQPLIPLAVTVGSIWMAWQGLARRRFTVSVQGAVWMVSAIVLGMWILFAPAGAIQTAMIVPDVGSGLANAAVSQVRVDEVALDCPGGSTKSITAMEGESAQDLKVRETREMLWVAFQCRPWQAGQFGADPAGQEAAQEYGYQVLLAQSLSGGSPQSHVEANQEHYEEIAEAIENDHPEVFPMFRGSLGEARLGVASAALLGSVLGGGLILAASVALLVFKMAFLVGCLFAPIFLALGIAPGPGRRLLGQYGNVMVGLLIKQVAMVLVVGVLLLCYSLIFSQGLAFGEQIIALAVLFLGFLAFWLPLWQIVRSHGRGRGEDASAVGAPTALTTATRRSAETWRWRSQQWSQRKMAQVSRKLIPGGASAAAAGAGAAASGQAQTPAGEETGSRPDAPRLGEHGQEQRVTKLARGQGAPRPARDREAPAGYRGSERVPADAPAAPTPAGRERAAEDRQQEVDVLRAVRAVHVGASEPRRDPEQAPPVDPRPRPEGSAARPAVVPPTVAPEPVRPPTRTRDLP